MPSGALMATRVVAAAGLGGHGPYGHGGHELALALASAADTLLAAGVAPLVAEDVLEQVVSATVREVAP